MHCSLLCWHHKRDVRSNTVFYYLIIPGNSRNLLFGMTTKLSHVFLIFLLCSNNNFECLYRPIISDFLNWRSCFVQFTIYKWYFFPLAYKNMHYHTTHFYNAVHSLLYSFRERLVFPDNWCIAAQLGKAPAPLAISKQAQVHRRKCAWACVCTNEMHCNAQVRTWTFSPAHLWRTQTFPRCSRIRRRSWLANPSRSSWSAWGSRAPPSCPAPSRTTDPVGRVIITVTAVSIVIRSILSWAAESVWLLIGCTLNTKSSCRRIARVLKPPSQMLGLELGLEGLAPCGGRWGLTWRSCLRGSEGGWKRGGGTVGGGLVGCGTLSGGPANNSAPPAPIIACSLFEDRNCVHFGIIVFSFPIFPLELTHVALKAPAGMVSGLTADKWCLLHQAQLTAAAAFVIMTNLLEGFGKLIFAYLLQICY